MAQTSTNREHIGMLEHALACVLKEEVRESFEDMKEKLLARPTHDLSEKQLKFVKNVLDQHDVPQYENLVSRGLVPRGKEVETPPALQNLPKRPPSRRVEE
jgi:uncharacterized protein YpiB (UPF0302 family)